jgi:hypothetical protein
MLQALSLLAVSSSAFAPAHFCAPTRPRTALRAVDYEAELYASAAFASDDAALVDWVAAWAERAVIDKKSATVKLTTPVKLEKADAGVRLVFAPRNTGYADKDDDKDDWDADAKKDKKKKLAGGEGGVEVSVAGGVIAARRCEYEGGIIKQMSEDKIVTQLEKDVKAAGFAR